MNPDGYHNDNHYTTMYDLLLMSKIVIECETILKYTGLSNDSVYFESGQYREWHNTNLLVNPTSQFYIEGVFGLKTGYTSLAGHCLLTAHKSRDNCIIVGVFRCDTSEHRFEDANKIINYKN